MEQELFEGVGFFKRLDDRRREHVAVDLFLRKIRDNYLTAACYSKQREVNDSKLLTFAVLREVMSSVMRGGYEFPIQLFYDRVKNPQHKLRLNELLDPDKLSRVFEGFVGSMAGNKDALPMGRLFTWPSHDEYVFHNWQLRLESAPAAIVHRLDFGVVMIEPWPMFLEALVSDARKFLPRKQRRPSRNSR